MECLAFIWIPPCIGVVVLLLMGLGILTGASKPRQPNSVAQVDTFWLILKIVGIALVVLFFFFSSKS